MRSRIVLAICVIAISLGCKKKLPGETATRTPGTQSMVSSNLPFGLAVNDDRIFWTEQTTKGTILSMPLEGGAVTTLVSQQNEPRQLHLDETHLYWVTDSIVRADLAGQSPSTLTGFQGDFVVGPTQVYFAGRYDAILETYYTHAVPLEGGTPVELGEGAPLAVDETSLYASANHANAIIAYPLSGGTPTTISDLPPTNAFGVDEQNYYFVKWPHVMKAPKSNPAMATRLGTIDSDLIYFMVYDDAVYWLEAGKVGTGKLIMKVPIAGGDQVTFHSGITSSVSLAADAQSLYWTEHLKDGKIWRKTPR